MFTRPCCRLFERTCGRRQRNLPSSLTTMTDLHGSNYFCRLEAKCNTVPRWSFWNLPATGGKTTATASSTRATCCQHTPMYRLLGGRRPTSCGSVFWDGGIHAGEYGRPPETRATRNGMARTSIPYETRGKMDTGQKNHKAAPSLIHSLLLRVHQPAIVANWQASYYSRLFKKSSLFILSCRWTSQNAMLEFLHIVRQCMF